jgi:hypothetical protein
MVWRNVVNALIGIWFIVSPAVLPFRNDTAMAWTSVIGGAILLVLAGSAALMEGARRQVWLQVVTGLVGIWFIIAPWVLAFTSDPGTFWTSLILGIVALILSIWDFEVLPRTAAVQQSH